MKDWNELRAMMRATHENRQKSGRAPDGEALQVMQITVLTHIAESLQRLVELAERAEAEGRE